MYNLTDEDLNLLDKLRDKGYVIFILSPEELEGASPHKVESALHDHAECAISVLKTNEVDDE